MYNVYGSLVCAFFQWHMMEHIQCAVVITGYFLQVEYDATGFLEKNRDRLPVEIMNILRTSDNRVVKTLFQTPLTKTGMFCQQICTDQNGCVV